MRLSTHVSEDLGLENSIDSVCSLLHLISNSCFPIFNLHSPIMCSSLWSAGLGAFWHCHWYIFFKVYLSEYNHVWRILALTNNYCTHHCNVETAKVVVFLRTLQQENDVVSYLKVLCFRPMLAITIYVILHNYTISQSLGDV